MYRHWNARFAEVIWFALW